MCAHLREVSIIFVRMLQEEAENFENAGLPVARPNSMNNYGGLHFPCHIVIHK